MLSLVIPAKAGIQLNVACEALEIGLCVLRTTYFTGFPAFAGMTSTSVKHYD